MPFEIIRNDICTMAVDAVVNSAQPDLLGGGGLDGRIHEAAGPGLAEACRSLGGCRVGQAKISRSYGLPCRYVIHTVGPVWRGGFLGERGKLAGCYLSCLELAKEYGLGSIAFPLISSGAFGYPKEKALRVAVDTIAGYLMENEMQVYLVIYGSETFSIGSKLFSNIAQYIDDNYVAEHADKASENRMRRIREERRGFPDERLLAEEDFTAGYRSDFGSCFDAAPPPSASRGAPRIKTPRQQMAVPYAPAEEKSASILPERLFEELDAGFSETLLRLIDLSGKKDSEIYKRANVDRKLFSKIRNNPSYKPSKTTALAFAVALRLDIDQTRDFIGRAGYALSHSSKGDIIVEYFIKQGQYDLFKINEALFAFDQSLLGS